MRRSIKKPNRLPGAELVTIEEASDRLGRGFSRSNILRRINSGEWEEGEHWIDCRRDGTFYRQIKVNLTAVFERMATPAAHR
jgi:hypothetical protein